MEKQVCKICGDSFSSNAFGMHIKHKHKLSGKEYYHKYVNTDPNAGKCKMCGKETYFFGVLEDIDNIAVISAQEKILICERRSKLHSWITMV